MNEVNCSVSGDVTGNASLANISGCEIRTQEASGPSPLVYFMVFYYLLCIAIIWGGNGLVIVVIARTPMLQTATNKFVTWLAAADIILGFSIFLRIPQALNALDNAYLCLFRFYTINASGIMSGLSCLGVAMERYLGVFHPLRYPDLVTSSRINLIMGLCAIYATIVPLGPMLGENDWYPGVFCEFYLVNTMAWLCVLLGHVVVITGGVMVLHALIAWECRKSYQRLAQLCVPEMITEKRKLIVNMKAIKTFALVSGILIIAWIPNCLLAVTFSMDRDYYHGHAVWSKLWLTSTFVVLFNSICNPFIYAIRMESFRQPMKRHLRCGATPGDDNSSNAYPRVNQVAPADA